eukprot:c12114_g1_i1.p1 GENE.c12114_g1_i1~~c12114_g1_i1.p1  ORF type:complete len:394 (+),score=70.71 c12114_g1_i1:98-1183(+)
MSYFDRQQDVLLMLFVAIATFQSSIVEWIFRAYMSLFPARPSFTHTILVRGKIDEMPLKKLEEEIVCREKQLDLIDGAEKRIFWSRPYEKTPLSLVYLHGWSACRQELDPLPQNIARELKANLFSTRLSGHGFAKGNNIEPFMKEARPEKMFGDAVEALKIGCLIGERVVLIACSTGGALATWLASHPEFRSSVAALIVISPAYALATSVYPPFRLVLSFVSLLPPPLRSLVESGIAYGLLGPVHKINVNNEECKKYWICQYPSVALVALVQTLWQAECATNFKSVVAPVLVLGNVIDNTVSFDCIIKRFSEFGTPHKALESFGHRAHHHVIAGRVFSPNTTDECHTKIMNFISTAVAVSA